MPRRRKGYSPPPRRHRSRQKKHGGGKFGSERQRKWMWANAPSAAKKWAHNRKTRKGDWPRSRKRKGRRRRSRSGTRRVRR